MDGLPECPGCRRQLPIVDDARLWRLGWEPFGAGWICAACWPELVPRLDWSEPLYTSRNLREALRWILEKRTGLYLKSLL